MCLELEKHENILRVIWFFRFYFCFCENIWFREFVGVAIERSLIEILASQGAAVARSWFKTKMNILIKTQFCFFFCFWEKKSFIRLMNKF